MKRECKHRDGDYQVWSGTDTTVNLKKRGMFIVYWKGAEIRREEYLDQAQWFIDKHKQTQKNKYIPKETPISQETSEWIDKLMS